MSGEMAEKAAAAAAKPAASACATFLAGGEFGEHGRLAYLNQLMKASGDDGKARIIPSAELPPPDFLNADRFEEPIVIEPLRRSRTLVVHHQQSFLNMLEGKIDTSMLANKDSIKFLLGEKKSPPFSIWFATTKEAIFARKNLPATATLVASSAAAGVITTAANPAICFGFYALFITAIAFVIIPLRKI